MSAGSKVQRHFAMLCHNPWPTALGRVIGEGKSRVDAALARPQAPFRHRVGVAHVGDGELMLLHQVTGNSILPVNVLALEL